MGADRLTTYACFYPMPLWCRAPLCQPLLCQPLWCQPLWCRARSGHLLRCRLFFDVRTRCCLTSHPQRAMCGLLRARRSRPTGYAGWMIAWGNSYADRPRLHDTGPGRNRARNSRNAHHIDTDKPHGARPLRTARAPVTKHHRTRRAQLRHSNRKTQPRRNDTDRKQTGG